MPGSRRCTAAVGPTATERSGASRAEAGQYLHQRNHLLLLFNLHRILLNLQGQERVPEAAAHGEGGYCVGSSLDAWEAAVMTAQCHCYPVSRVTLVGHAVRFFKAWAPLSGRGCCAAAPGIQPYLPQVRPWHLAAACLPSRTCAANRAPSAQPSAGSRRTRRRRGSAVPPAAAPAPPPPSSPAGRGTPPSAGRASLAVGETVI